MRNVAPDYSQPDGKTLLVRSVIAQYAASVHFQMHAEPVGAHGCGSEAAGFARISRIAKGVAPFQRTRWRPYAFVPSEDQPRDVMPTMRLPTGAKCSRTIPDAKLARNGNVAP